jgi:hypothetical protein
VGTAIRAMAARMPTYITHKDVKKALESRPRRVGVLARICQ